MKHALVFILMMFSITAYQQGIKIKWEDYQGREFSISAPSGSFSYGMIQGDRVSYDYEGRVSKVGSVIISYDYEGRVSQVGSVRISYDYEGRVSRVGNLSVQYDYSGRVTGTTGSVN